MISQGAEDEAAGLGQCSCVCTISCEFCGEEFMPTRRWQRCCSGRCRAALSREREAEARERWLPDDPGRAE